MVFSIVNNPFAVLGVSPCAERGDIEDACEDRLVSRPSDEQVLLRAKQALLTPKSRLSAELRWLWGVDSQRAVRIVQALGKIQDSALARGLLDLPPLARANLAADACVRLATIQFLPQLIVAHSEIDVDVLSTEIDDANARAGFPTVHAAQVKDGLTDVIRDHAIAAMAGMAASGNPQVALKALLVDPRFRANRMLDELVAQYDQWSSPHLAAVESDLGEALARLSKDPACSCNEVVAGLKRWRELSEPMQQHSQRFGLDEPRSLRVYRNTRGACVDLANEHQRFATAADIVVALRETFSGLPTAKVELEADQTLLEKLKNEQLAENALRPLFTAVSDSRENVRELTTALGSGGLAGATQPVCRAIYDSLCAAHGALAGSAMEDAPARIVRNLALELNNDDSEPAAALALLEGLEAALPLGAELSGALHADIAVLRNNLGWARLNSAIAANRLGEALKEVDALIAADHLKEDREKLLSVKSFIQKRQSKRFFTILFWSAVGLVLLYSVVSSAIHGPPSSQLSSPPGGVLGNDLSEDTPPVQTGQVLTVAQIRYCVFQKARLAAANSLITSNSGIDRYNAAIQDFNSRCSNFQYAPGDMDTVNTDLQSAQAKIQSDGSQLAQEWN